jgi:hypothetical protein
MQFVFWSKQLDFPAFQANQGLCHGLAGFQVKAVIPMVAAASLIFDLAFERFLSGKQRRQMLGVRPF